MAEHSLLNLLKTMNYSGLNDLTAALNNAIRALETAKNSDKSFVEAPGAQHVKDCIDAVSALDEELNKAGDWVNKQEALEAPCLVRQFRNTKPRLLKLYSNETNLSHGLISNGPLSIAVLVY